MDSEQRWLSEPESKQLVQQFGIPVPKGQVIAPFQESPMLPPDLPFPCVVKIISPQVVHKSEVQGVRLNVLDTGSLHAAMRTMEQDAAMQGYTIRGFLVEEMVEGDVEILVGSVVDPRFGPIITLGMGGVYVEVLDDVVSRICPVSPYDVVDMIDELRGSPLIKGTTRGQPGWPLAPFVHAVMRIGGPHGLLFTSGHTIREFEINPLLLHHGQIIALDVRCRITKEAPSP